jgi:hypothetical protein
VAGLVVAAIVVAIVLATSSGGSSNARQASNQKAGTAGAGSSTHPSSKASTKTSSTGSAPTTSSSGSSGSAVTPAASSGSSAPAASGSGTPVSAVESFYHLAATHQYSSAWALADPAFRNQLGGYSSFESGQSGDRSITFTSAKVTNQSGNTATVDVGTISDRYNGTQHCSGPVNLVRGSSGWLVDHIDINCSAPA